MALLLYLLLYVLYGLVLATPVLIIALFLRQARLQKQLNKHAEENTKELTRLQRAVGELQAKLAATAPPATPAPERASSPEARQPVPVPRSFPHLQIPPPVVVSPRVAVPPPSNPQPTPPVPVTEKKPESRPEQKPLVPTPASPVLPVIVTAPSSPTASPVTVSPQKPLSESKPAEPGPGAPATQVPPPAAQPAPPPVPPKIIPPLAVPHSPAIPPPSPTAIPPAAAARISTAPPISPLGVPAPKSTREQRMKSASAIEEALGANWFAKLGVGMTVIGVALLGMLVIQNLNPAGRALIVFGVAAVLLAGGIFLEKREKYRLLGRGGIGGGWALLFFTAYGIHHVATMRVLDSLVLDCILMLAVALGMAAHTLRYKSQFVTGFAFLLGYVTVTLSFSEVRPLASAGTSESTVYGLFAGVILAIGLVTIVLKMGWFELEVFGILSSYLNHLYWLYKLLGIDGAHGRAFPEFHASLAMLFFYWLTFRISYVVRGTRTDFEEHVSTVSALLNTLLLLGVLRFQSVEPDLAYIALLIIGALEFMFAQLPVTRRRRRAFIILSLLGAALMMVSVPSHFSGNPVAYLWLVSAEVFLFAGIIFGEVVFLRLGLFTGLLVGIDLLAFNFRALVMLRAKTEDLASESGILFAVCGVALYLNALYVASRWKQSFRATLDRRSLDIHSYFGAFATATAAWALFANDWTASAFAAIMLALAFLGRRLESRHLQMQYALLGALTLYRAFVFNLHIESPAHTHITTRLITLPLLGAIFYLTAKLAALRDDQEQRAFRGLFAFAGTALFAALMWFEVPELWQPLLFIAFAVALSENARALRYHALAVHAHGITLLAVFTALTADQYNVHVWHTIPVHAFGALPVVAGCYWIAKRLGAENARHLEIARVAYIWIAAGVMVWILEEALRAPWIAVGWIAFAVALALSTRWIRYRPLAWQANVVALAAFVRTFTFNLDLHQPLWRGVSLRLFTVGLVIAGAYVLAKIAADALEEFAYLVRNAYSWAAALFVGLLIFGEAPHDWMAVFFLAAGIVLALVGRRWNLPHLGFQEHLLAIAAMARTFDYNYHLTTYYGNFSARILTVSIVAAGLYAISRKATAPDAPYALSSAYLHTTAATSLLALLMWYECFTGWLAAFWALFAFALAAVDRRFKLDDLRWQAHGLAALAMIRSVSINMYVEDTWHGLSVRLLSLSIVAVVFYAMSRFIRMPEQWRARDFHHIYSWSASLIVSLLLWHELRPVSIAVGLAAFGLVLFEYGLLRKIAQFRYQSYVAFTAAFVRIFFANLTADDPGVFWGQRMFTVAPLVLIFFFVYAQLPEKEENTARDRRFRFDAFVAYLGTATVVALFYFQFQPEWVVTAYAATVFALFGAAWVLGRRIFLHQGILLTLATLARGIAHNLFGSGYFGDGNWMGRYFVVGSAVAILLATLFFAFPLRGRYAFPPNASRWRKVASALVARPEQLQFFAPIVLLTIMLALKMKESMVTVSWGIEGVFIIVLALAFRERSFLRAGFAILLLSVAKVFAMDMWRLDLLHGTITFIGVGLAVTAVSFLYIRFSDNLKQYL
jgi:Predicted membrane protein (DUF2339)